MKSLLLLFFILSATWMAGFTYRKGMTEYLRPKVQQAAQQESLENRQRMLRRQRERDFDLAEELQISAEEAESIHAFEVDEFNALHPPNKPLLPEAELRRKLHEQKERFADKFGPQMAKQHRDYEKYYTSRAEVGDLRERLAPLGVSFSYAEAKALLETVKREYTTSVEYLKYAGSAEEFQKGVEVQVEYNRKLREAAPKFLTAKQCNVLTHVLRERLREEYREAVEYIQKEQPGLVLTNTLPPLD